MTPPVPLPLPRLVLDGHSDLAVMGLPGGVLQRRGLHAARRTAAGRPSERQTPALAATTHYHYVVAFVGGRLSALKV